MCTMTGIVMTFTSDVLADDEICVDSFCRTKCCRVCRDADKEESFGITTCWYSNDLHSRCAQIKLTANKLTHHNTTLFISPFESHYDTQIFFRMSFQAGIGKDNMNIGKSQGILRIRSKV